MSQMPVVGRIYTQGRYRRASVLPGPGQALVLEADANNAIALARAEPRPIQGAITRETNEALTAFHRRWHLEADWLVCQGCKRPLIASRDGEPTKHKVGCNNSGSLHPWAELRGLLGKGKAEDGETKWIMERSPEACGSWASSLREAGHTINAGDEVGYIQRWLLDLYSVHGSAWRNRAQEELARAGAKAANDSSDRAVSNG